MNHAKYESTPTHDEIGARSRHLWQLAGSPSGRDLEFWLAAEIEVRSERETTRKVLEEEAQTATPRTAKLRK
jgi:Protein of unknown function (DUF2934)